MASDKRLHLTLVEMRACNNALSFLLAGEFDESAGPDPGFTREQAERAQEKLQDRIAELERGQRIVTVKRP